MGISYNKKELNTPVIGRPFVYSRSIILAPFNRKGLPVRILVATGPIPADHNGGLFCVLPGESFS